METVAYTVYSNQQEAGRSIVRALDQDDAGHVLLLAQMQMGKSGTYWFAILEALFGECGCGFEHVLLISGNRETELLRQVQQDKRGYLDWYFASPFVATRSPEEIREMRARAERNVRVLWGSDLDKANAPQVQSNTLVVWDESHFAQSKENKPYEFLCRNGLRGLLHTTEGGESPANVRLLTVSATPFSELLTGASKDRFRVVRLEPGEGYCGVKHYRDRGLIRPSFQVNASSRDALKELLAEHARPGKYVVLRLPDNRASVTVSQEVCREMDLDCKLFNSKRKDLSVRDMARAPERPTVILVSGMLRMGKVLPKEHIAMVFEASTKSKKRHADTTLQGLLGRVCGYSGRVEEGFDITVYVESNILEHVEEYIGSYDSPEGPLVGNAMNVRFEPPERRSLKPYHAIPLTGELAPPLTKLGNVRPSKMKGWLRERVDAGDFSEEVAVRVNALLKTSLTTLSQRDMTKPTNSWLARVVNDCCAEGTRKATSYKTMAEGEICFTRAYHDDQKADVTWMVLRSVLDDHEFQVEQETRGEEDEDIRAGYYVLNRCAYKNV